MFDPVFGHERIKKVLARTLKNNALHHALCLHGPSGIGKRLLAFEIAKAMLCETRNGCGSCRHCHKVTSGNHPDLTQIEPDGNDIKVDQIRELVENLHFRPFEARVRMILLDQVERLGEGAANAFLKSLEEPPTYVFFILVTSDLKGLLPTIQSRCQKMGFQSLTQRDKTQILTSHFQLQPNLAERLAAISFRQLETDPAAWDGFREDVKKIISFYKLMLKEGHALDYLEAVTRDKTRIWRFLDHFNAVTREIALRAKGLKGQTIFADFEPELAALSVQIDAKWWAQIWQKTACLYGERRRNLNLSLWFNALSVTELGLSQASKLKLKQRLTAR